MHGAERREELYREAHGELLRRIDHERIAELDDHERRTAIDRCVRDLAERWPELDGQLCRRLMADALADEQGRTGHGRRHPHPPASGQANVTSLRRDERDWIR